MWKINFLNSSLEDRTTALSLSRQNRTAVVFTTYKFEACTMNHHRSAERFLGLLKCLLKTGPVICLAKRSCDDEKSLFN